MNIRAAIAIVLIGLSLTACSSGGDSPGAPQQTPVSSSVSRTTATKSAATNVPLSASWIPRLERLSLESCRNNQFAMSCLSDAMALQTAALELGSEADKRGDSIVKAEAVQVAADLQKYSDECVTSSAGSPERTKCLTVLMSLPNMHEGLVAAIHESEAK